MADSLIGRLVSMHHPILISFESKVLWRRRISLTGRTAPRSAAAAQFQNCAAAAVGAPRPAAAARFQSCAPCRTAPRRRSSRTAPRRRSVLTRPPARATHPPPRHFQICLASQPNKLPSIFENDVGTRATNPPTHPQHHFQICLAGQPQKFKTIENQAKPTYAYVGCASFSMVLNFCIL